MLIVCLKNKFSLLNIFLPIAWYSLSANKIENLYFINTVPEFLDENGRPKSELFVGDQLHLNKKGYKVWNKVIRTAIEGQLSIP